MMKVFVYSKKTNRKIAQVNDVVGVSVNNEKHEISVCTSSDETFTFSTKEMKTTVYQN